MFDEQARKLAVGPDRAGFLVQGTLYPDVIESVAVRGPSQTIKTHHNVGGLPEDLPFALIEPLRELFKDEVRSIGRELGLPEEMLTKHPFPGPGLAVRLLGEVTEERLAPLREADAIVVEEIRRAGLYEKVWQAFAVLLPVRSVGVMGDERSYGLHDRGARRGLGRCDDRGLDAASGRSAGADFDENRERSERDQPGGVRYQLQTAEHDRVGISVNGI